MEIMRIEPKLEFEIILMPSIIPIRNWCHNRRNCHCKQNGGRITQLSKQFSIPKTGKKYFWLQP